MKDVLRYNNKTTYIGKQIENEQAKQTKEVWNINTNRCHFIFNFLLQNEKLKSKFEKEILYNLNISYNWIEI